MGLREDLSRVVARDARYTVDAYIFILESLEHAKTIKKRHRKSGRSSGGARGAVNHVSGQELSRAACDLALDRYGVPARQLLRSWGVNSTADLGNIVYRMIASGDLEKTESDSPSDFENVFDFEEALAPDRAFSFEHEAKSAPEAP